MIDKNIGNSWLNRFMGKKEMVFQNIVKMIPAWFNSNLISGVRALLIVPIYFTYQEGLYAWVVILFFLGLFTDILDGVHARYYHQETTLGKLLDPLADKILFVGVLLLIAPDRLSQIIIYTIITLEISLVLLAAVIAPLIKILFNKSRQLGANNAGKIKMTLEGIAVIILMLGLNSAPVAMVAEIILWLAAIFAIISIVLHLSLKDKRSGDTNQEGPSTIPQ
ncbi:CDP-alcohol phosphatidyltransferase family protein [Patescibacteria group bacterium]|nr:CDP-alcohol phosphatidyltransferase family protein [Patescibacteria group bacterium]